MQFWSETNPCGYCGAISNAGHAPSCRNADLYDDQGHSIMRVPAHTQQENRMITSNEVRSRFGFHKASLEGPDATLPKHSKLRVLFTEFAEVLNDMLPDGRNKSVAFTELESASMWAHKAVAQTDPLIEE